MGFTATGIGILLPTLIFLCPGLGSSPGGGLPVSRQQQEEGEDYFRRWLKTDVAYIITEDEKAIFNRLETQEEKEQFIEQFWYRRDPDPTTGVNEFKEEHYRRIAYANQWFKSGKAGWMTDRGRIYIVHGPPTDIEAHPTGGTYQRPQFEGGGFTSTHPFEIWRYRHIEGVGDDVELEFVDPVGGGEYRLTVDPDEKDALLHVPGAGLNRAEGMGLASKSSRLPPTFNTLRAKDSPFARYETFARVQQPAEIKYHDLREIVDVRLTFDDLPVQVRLDYFRLDSERVLVPITVKVSNRELTYHAEEGIHLARAAVYGLVTSLTNRIAAEFEDELVSAYSPDQLEAGLSRESLYQRVVLLDSGVRYRLDLVVKDVRSGKVGVVRQAIAPPRYSEESLSASSLLLSSSIQKLPEIPEGNPMFVLGDLKIHPSLTNRFVFGGPVGVYLQLYNAALDRTTFAPALRVRYRIVGEDGDSLEVLDTEEKSVFSFSDRRVILVKALPVTQLKPGQYSLNVRIEDLVAATKLEAEARFELVGR